MIWVEAALAGLAVGVIVGALGAGGGIVSVPILVYLLDQEPHAATASSLVIVMMAALAGLPHHARAGNVVWREGLVFGALTLAGSAAGARASALVDPHTLMLLFAGLLLTVAVAMARQGIRARRPDDGPESAERDRTRIRWGRVLAAATLTGLLTGFFGVGGGFAVVPVLVLTLGLPIRLASGTSLVVMILASGAGLLSRAGTGVVIDWQLTGLFAAGSMLGGLAGGPLSARARPATLTLLFAALLGVVAGWIGVATLVGAGRVLG